jgi:hypothetical protein
MMLDIGLESGAAAFTLLLLLVTFVQFIILTFLHTPNPPLCVTTDL